ncbi:MAG: permease [Opitutus sp.]|nr:permease [Opitutus sp.]
MQDVRFAFRQFARSPALFLAIVGSIALGLAANASVLAWLETFVLRPLPGVREQSRLVALVSNTGGGNASLPDLRDFGAMDDTFAGALASMSTTACLTIDRQAHWLEAQIVSANFFELLGVAPLLGRTFRPDEDQHPGGDPVAVISEQTWRRHFGAALDIVGRTVELNRRTFTIIGVVPAEFRGTINPLRTELWTPLSMISEVRNQSRAFLTRRSDRGWHNLARLQAGVSLAQARAAVTAADGRLAAAYPETNRDAFHRVVPLNRVPWGAQTILGPALALLLAVALGVQLVVIANTANLLLARALARRKEIAIRLASGATRGRLARQLLTECLLLALVGGTLGAGLAWWCVGALAWLLPPDLAARAQIQFSISPMTLALTAALAVVTGLAFGFVPALQATQPDLATALKDSGHGAVGSGSSRRWRSALVVAEIGLATILLIGAALCVDGLRRAQQIDVGFRADHVLVAPLQIGMNGYDAQTGLAFYRDLRRRLATHPDIEEAALASWLPLGLAGCKGYGVTVEGHTWKPGEDRTIEVAIVSARYFSALRIPIVGGREFDDGDDVRSPAVAIVNRRFAEKFWPGQDPLGRRFRAGGAWRTIVGVVPTGKYNRVDEAPRPFFFLPDQQGVPDLDLGIVVRTRGEPEALARPLREIVRAQDPAVDVLQTVTLANHAGLALFPQVAATKLLTVLGAGALLLAMIGVYAVMAHAVGQRTREFGVRLALGATRGDVLRLVLGQGLWLALGGIVLGLVTAMGASRLLAGFLFGASPFDPLILLGVPALLAATAMVASWLPAWRASRVDPMEALRAE